MINFFGHLSTEEDGFAAQQPLLLFNHLCSDTEHHPNDLPTLKQGRYGWRDRLINARTYKNILQDSLIQQLSVILEEIINCIFPGHKTYI